MDSWEDRWAHDRRAAREKREREELEYDKEQAERAAARAEREAIEARRLADRERAAAQEEAEYAREAERNAEAELRHQRSEVEKFARALRAIIAAWDGFLPDGQPVVPGTDLTLGQAIDAARHVLCPIPPDPE